MKKEFYSIALLVALVTIIPTAEAQLSIGGEANQKLIEVELNKSEIINVKHVIDSSKIPVSIDLFDGAVIESIIVTNDNGNEKEFGLIDDVTGNTSVTIFPSKQNSIIKYTLENASTFYDNMWTVRIQYSETFSIIFSEEIDLIFINNNFIKLDNKKGISANNGGNAIIQYYSEIPKTIEEVRWEENKFDVEIITNSKIDEFNFDQASKNITFQVNEKNKFVTISMYEELLGGPYVILLNDEKIEYNYSSNENYVSLSIKPNSSGEITIIGTTVIPEFSMFLPLIMGFLIILTVPFMKKFSLR
jgi:hypothetical protein